MDVLDLSKKSKEKENNDFTTRDKFNNKTEKDLYATSQLLLTEALLKAGQGSTPSASLEALYANAIYRNFSTFPTGTGILPPYMFNPHVFNQDYCMKERLQKELVRGLQ